MAAGLQSSRILVVDDDTVLADFLPALFATQGHTVATARSGEAALDLLRHGHRCDVILTDLHLGGISGCALAAELAAARSPGTLLLGMSGRDPSRAELSLLDAFLPKPFGLREFNAALHHAHTSSHQRTLPHATGH